MAAKLTPFQGIRTFLGCEHTKNLTDVDIAVAGVPFDLGTSLRSGTRMGPSAIRSASMMLKDDICHYNFNPCEKASIIDYGDFPIEVASIYDNLGIIEKEASKIISKHKHLICMGGDHTITLALLRAHVKHYGKLALIHFDAHHDYWPGTYGATHYHGSWLYDAILEDLIDCEHSIMIGIRAPSDPKYVEELEDKGFKIITALDIHRINIGGIIGNIKRHNEGVPTYLTFDIDALDPSCAPGTGTPEIGGLFTWQADYLLRNLNSLDMRGMDLVEVAPQYDNGEITALAGATMMWNYINNLIERKL
jgi:guanidinopropionase